MAKVYITHALSNFYYWYLYDRRYTNRDYIKTGTGSSTMIELPVGQYTIKANNPSGVWQSIKNFDIDKETQETCVVLEHNTN